MKKHFGILSIELKWFICKIESSNTVLMINYHPRNQSHAAGSHERRKRKHKPKRKHKQINV